MSDIEVRHLSKSFDLKGVKVEALKDINLSIKPGDIYGIIGMSGAGKSTLVRCLNFLERPTEGEVLVGGKDLSTLTEKELRKQRQEIAMIFQHFNLLMQKNVIDNICFPLLLRGEKKADARRRAMELLKLVDLEEKANAYPSQLSGGQKQRVAIARALVIEPSVLLFDEPLSNLDAKLRVTMRTEIRRIQQEVGITAIYVTHDQSEAMALSDRIIIMRSGVVEQIGSPQEIYYHPVNEFVADFIGEANFLKGKLEAIENGRARINVSGDICHAAPVPGMEVGKEYTIVLRPEAIRIGETGMLPCKVELSCFMGSYQNYLVKGGDTLVKLTDPNPKN